MFFPQLLLDQWGIEGKIDLTGTELVVLAEGRKYLIDECVYIVAEVTGANDPHGFVGKVKPKAVLDELGAEILENSMIIGDNAYDVVQGFVGAPVGTFAEHLRDMPPDSRPAPGIMTDEDLLAAFLTTKL